MKELGLLTLTESEWAKAKHRADVIGPLAELSSVGKAAAKEAAEKLGISSRTVYELVKKCRAGSGLVTDMAAKISNGGKGKERISIEISTIVSEVIDSAYLTKQMKSVESIIREIELRCRKAGLRRPAANTIRARIRSLDPTIATKRRHGTDAARSLSSAGGKVPELTAPLDVVQIDHTPMDVMIVDEKSRQSIGRPYLTLAIDSLTRCIVGMLLTLEAPSATSVGLVLAHAVRDKRSWLDRLNLSEFSWPMHGKPEKIYTDNAAEFHSEALARGCEQHGIEIGYRPAGQPHFGGIIERVIGTAMKMAHELPGTTFSNAVERGNYDSEAEACLTLHELERWLALAICSYHETIHKSLWESPIAKWNSYKETRKIEAVANEKSFLIDFLPVIRRSITRTGFVIDHITYYADSLKPWIARRAKLEKFIVRRDPRDLSRVWILDPESKGYLEIPYRSLASPAVTLWEHKIAVAKLREAGRAKINESVLFRMIEKMREIELTAKKETRKSRRNRERRSHLPNVQLPEQRAPICIEMSESEVKPFEDIEEW